VFGGASWAIMNSNVLNYDDIAVDGYIAPPTLVAYVNGVKSLESVSLLDTSYNELTSSTEEYVTSAGG